MDRSRVGRGNPIKKSNLKFWLCCQCVDGLIDEVDRIQAVNEEVLRTAEAMAKIGKGLG